MELGIFGEKDLVEVEGEMIRKLTPAKKARRREVNHKAVMEIYERAKQGGSDAYLVVNQDSDPARVAAILAEAEDRRSLKTRILIPKPQGIQFRESAEKPKYARLGNGQIVGHPPPDV